MSLQRSIRYDEMAVITERPIEIRQTYSPKGTGRKVTIDRIPAFKVTVDDETDVHLEVVVCDRIHKLIQRALRANDIVKQRITYTAPRARPTAPARAARRARP